jgi:hypothetical protein
MTQKAGPPTKSIGARFRSARALVPQLNRKSFCERHGINRYTMQSWENGLHISKGKNIEKFVEALAQEGVACSIEWLLEGKGVPAQPFHAPDHQNPDQLDAAPNKKGAAHPFLSQVDDLAHRLQDLGHETKIFCVEDDSMVPKFAKGDLILAARQEGDTAIWPYCLVEISRGRLLLRRASLVKDQVVFMALDDRVPVFTMKSTAKLYRVVALFPAQ